MKVLAAVCLASVAVAVKLMEGSSDGDYIYDRLSYVFSKIEPDNCPKGLKNDECEYLEG